MIRTGLVLIAYLWCPGFFSSAQGADDIVKKHVEAVGGSDNWKKVRSIKIAGSMSEEGKVIPFTTITLDKKGYRAEYTLEGMVNFTIITPTQGWTFLPSEGQMNVEAIPAEMVLQQQDQLDAQGDPLIDYKTKGNKISYLGKDQVEGTDCYKIKVTYPFGKEATLYLEESSFYVIRSVEKTKANGKEEEVILNFSNYQKLTEGIWFPMSVETDGMAMTFNAVNINFPVNELIFKPESKK